VDTDKPEETTPGESWTCGFVVSTQCSEGWGCFSVFLVPGYLNLTHSLEAGNKTAHYCSSVSSTLLLKQEVTLISTTTLIQFQSMASEAEIAEIDRAAAKVLQGYDWSLVSSTKK